MKKLIFSLLIFSMILMSSSLVLGAECYDNSFPWGDANARTRICTSDIHPAEVGRSNWYEIDCEQGDRLYIDSHWNSCNEGGCGGTQKAFPYVYQIQPGDSHKEYTCWDFDERNGWWAWGATTLFWDGLSYQAPLPSPQCFAGQEVCNGFNFITCDSQLQFKDNGMVKGQCGVECVSVNDCSNPGDNTCTNHQCVLKGRVGYWRFEDNKCKSVDLLPSEITSIDYPTYEQCADNIEPIFGFDWLQWIIDWITDFLKGLSTGSIGGTSSGQSANAGSGGGHS